MDDLTQKIFDTIAQHPEITPGEFDLQTDFRKDLGLDSLVIAELTIELEDLFDIRFPDSLMSEVKTVNDVVKAVAAQTNY